MRGWRWVRQSMLAGCLVCFFGIAPARAEIFSGDVRLACEAILCLAASAGQPAACGPSLARYFGITGKNIFSDRINFLNLCPTSSAPNMPSLVRAIVGAAGQCDVGKLNQQFTTVGVSDQEGFHDVTVISDVMPGNCAAFFGHRYVKATAPHYVGDPLNGGHWQ